VCTLWEIDTRMATSRATALSEVCSTQPQHNCAVLPVWSTKYRGAESSARRECEKSSGMSRLELGEGVGG
jgi:hypothetical protein